MSFCIITALFLFSYLLVSIFIKYSNQTPLKILERLSVNFPKSTIYEINELRGSLSFVCKDNKNIPDDIMVYVERSEYSNKSHFIIYSWKVLSHEAEFIKNRYKVKNYSAATYYLCVYNQFLLNYTYNQFTVPNTNLLKFIFSEKPTQICAIILMVWTFT